MKVSEVINKLSDYDEDLSVIIGGDGAFLGEVKGVFIDDDPTRHDMAKVVVIAEWEGK